MSDSDRWFRWCFNTFIFLMSLQLGMLLFLKSLFYQAEHNLKKNQAEVSFRCGDFDTEQNYWSLKESAQSSSQPCTKLHCPDSFWSQQTQGSEELHVISVKEAQAHYIEDGVTKPGHFVNIKVQSTQTPAILALVSQNMLQWKFQLPENHQLKEVLIIGPELVWVEGLPKDIKMTYFPKESICNFPTDWHEVANPHNEFRRFSAALKSYTGLDIKSFQGKETAREMHLPLENRYLEYNDEVERNLASDQKEKQKVFQQGISWQRQDQQLNAQSFGLVSKGEKKQIQLPQKVTHAFYEQGTQKLYVINNHKFGIWDWDKEKFRPIHMPLKMQALYWPSAMTFNNLRSEIYIYNDDRGGELFAFNVLTNQWRQVGQKIGYSLVALYFDAEKESLYGVRFDAGQIADVVEFDEMGQKRRGYSLPAPVDFSKNRWRARLKTTEQEVVVQVVHPASLDGDIHRLPLQSKPM